MTVVHLSGIILLAIVGVGCVGQGQPLELSNVDPSQNQVKIAQYYHGEAIRFLQKAEEMKARAVVYEGLFGSDSEWVKGARLLAQSYEQVARDHERMADQHMALAGRRPGRTSPAFP